MSNRWNEYDIDVEKIENYISLGEKVIIFYIYKCSEKYIRMIKKFKTFLELMFFWHYWYKNKYNKQK